MSQYSENFKTNFTPEAKKAKIIPLQTYLKKEGSQSIEQKKSILLELNQLIWETKEEIDILTDSLLTPKETDVSAIKKWITPEEENSIRETIKILQKKLETLTEKRDIIESTLINPEEALALKKTREQINESITNERKQTYNEPSANDSYERNIANRMINPITLRDLIVTKKLKEKIKKGITSDLINEFNTTLIDEKDLLNILKTGDEYMHHKTKIRFIKYNPERHQGYNFLVLFLDDGWDGHYKIQKGKERWFDNQRMWDLEKIHKTKTTS